MLKLRFKNNKHNAVWLVEPKVTIGKSTKNDLVVDDAGVTDFHAEILVDHESLVLSVLNPESPVTVNDKSVTKRAPLKVNDVLIVGRAQLQVVDPKQEPKAVPTVVRAETTGWSLKSNHPALANKVFNLAANTVVGRASDCDIVLAAAHLSRRHAQLSVKDGLLYVKDLGSANGTFVNGERVSEARVKRGDELRFDTLSFGVMGPADDLDKTTVREVPVRKPAAGKPKTPKKPDAKVRASLKASMAAPAPDAPEPEKSRSAFTGLTLVLLVLAGVAYWAWQQGWF